MKVVLVDNLLIEQNGRRVETVLQPHLGLISLLAVIRAAGHVGRLYDPKLALAEGRLQLDADLYLGIARQILSLRPDVVGFTSLGCNFICTLKVAQHLRALAPEVVVLLGGPHATILDKEILGRYHAFDYIVRHEAESTLPALLASLGNRDLSHIPGLTYRSADHVIVRNPGAPIIECLDDLPFPCYDAYPIEELDLQWLRVEAGRGCPFMCTFCSTASFFGRKYRLKSAQRLISELDELSSRYGVRQFSLQHDLFTVSREKVLDFCEAVADRRYIWKCSARMDCVDARMLAAMARAGCREIYFGVETGSPFLQRAAEKRLDLTVFYPTLDACDAVGIQPTVSFITGYPQEREEDQAATLDMVGSCFYRNPPPANVQLHLMTPEPGTQLLHDFKDQLRFDGFISDFTFPTLEPDDATVMASAPEVFMNNHYFDARLPRRRHVLVSTLYYVLYDLSPSVLSYLMDQFEGRLSVLVDAFDTWAKPRGVDVASGNALVRFSKFALGPSHPATSLVRYMIALATMTRPSKRHAIGARDEMDRKSSRSQRYRFNEEARLLRNIHDCPALLDRLAALQNGRPEIETQAMRPWRHGAASTKLLDAQIESDWSCLVQRHPPIGLTMQGVQQGHFLVIPVASTGHVKNITLDRSVCELLDMFRKPRSLHDFRRAMRMARTPRIIEELIEIEALTAAA